MNVQTVFTGIFFVFYILLQGGWAQQCGTPIASDFKTIQFTIPGGGNLGDTKNYMFTEYLKYEDGSYDAFFLRRDGVLKKVSSKDLDETNVPVTDVTVIPNVATGGYLGAYGFVFHPNYKENKWVFVSRTAAGGNPDPNFIADNLISRFEFSNGVLSEEKEILRIPITDSPFPSTQLRFDQNGHLYINVGCGTVPFSSAVFSNTNFRSSAEAASANTNDLRGSILRIIPDSSARGYRIPNGNFREYFEQHFKNIDRHDIAADYSLVAGKVAPEVYTKGHRNNFNLKLHPNKGWVIWGEVSEMSHFDELGIVKKPVFGGYPYFHGNNTLTLRHGVSTSVLPIRDEEFRKFPKNMSLFNTGATYLPKPYNPVVTSKRVKTPFGSELLEDRGFPFGVLPGTAPGDASNSDNYYGNGENKDWAEPFTPLTSTRYTSISPSDVYSFDLSLDSRNKFPKFFNDFIWVMDWEQNRVDAYRLFESNGEIAALPASNMKSTLGLSNLGTVGRYAGLSDASFTPDGTLLVLETNGVVHNVRYTGSCVEIDTSATSVTKESQHSQNVSSFGLEVQNSEIYSLELYDVHGVSVQKIILNKGGYHSFSSLFGKVLKGNIYFLRIRNMSTYKVSNVRIVF